MNNKARIASYVAQGLKASQIASIVGVSGAYISQLLKEAKDNPDSEFGMLLAEHTQKSEESFSEEAALTNKYMSLEHKLLDSIEGSMAFAELPALTRTLEVIANRQEKRAQRLATPNGGVTIHNVVQLTLPAHAIPEHTISPNREILTIGDQHLAPLSSEGVKALFAQRVVQGRVKELLDSKAAEREAQGTEF